MAGKQPYSARPLPSDCDSSDLSEAPSLINDDDYGSDEEQLSPGTSTASPETPSSSKFGVPIHLTPSSPLKRKTFSQSVDTVEDPCANLDADDESEHVHLSPPPKKRAVSRAKLPLSPLERLPNEIIQKVAVDLEADADLFRLTLASPTVAYRVIPENSDVWRSRFLARYDYPLVRNAYDFCMAYKLRRYVLRNFTTVAHRVDDRIILQLEVIRDILLETYFNHQPHLPGPSYSRNLKAFASPKLSPWIQTFLDCHFAGFEDRKYGSRNSIFETIQLALSHLLLSPRSALAHTVGTSRSNYDIVRVYNFGHEFTTIYTRLTPEEMVSTPPIPFKSSIFPNLKASSPPPPPVRYKLDTNVLLHIRNFWHRHLIDDSEPFGEHTYAAMARGLMTLGKTPREWDRSLQSDIGVSGEWYGHYSAVYPWPTTKKQLEERQSVADDWEDVDPLKLEFVTTNDYAEGFWPPALSSIPAFQNTIPDPSPRDVERFFVNEAAAAANGSRNQPNQKSKRKNARSSSNKCSTKIGPVYIRGLASFIDLSSVSSTGRLDSDGRKGKNPKSKNTSRYSSSSSSSSSSSRPTTTTTKPINKSQRYHPWISLRVRGIIHGIDPADTIREEDVPRDKRPENFAIPGWKRIVMVMYKPNVRYLLQVLEFAEGGSNVETNPLNTADIWSTTMTGGSSSGTGGTAGQADMVEDADVEDEDEDRDEDKRENDGSNSLPTQHPTYQQPIPSPPQSQDQGHDQGQNHSSIPTVPTLHDHLTSQLFQKISSSSFSPSSSLSKIHLLENSFSPPHTLSFSPLLTTSHIDYAYAYEGVICPGGRIMMGRWWRCHGDVGEGEGVEVDVDGDGVLVHNNEQEVGGDGEGETKTKGLERGPFVFWS